jgi:hypothetical protein
MFHAFPSALNLRELLGIMEQQSHQRHRSGKIQSNSIKKPGPIDHFTASEVHGDAEHIRCTNNRGMWIPSFFCASSIFLRVTCPYVSEIAARFPPPNGVVKKLRVRPCGSRCEPRGMKRFVHRHFDDFINRKDSEPELRDFSADFLHCQFNVFLLQLWACSRQR